jgi:mRNA-degrading endonuclease RelE of RelBE toxin-antitoxin system
MYEVVLTRAAQKDYQKLEKSIIRYFVLDNDGPGLKQLLQLKLGL